MKASLVIPVSKVLPRVPSEENWASLQESRQNSQKRCSTVERGCKRAYQYLSGSLLTPRLG